MNGSTTSNCSDRPNDFYDAVRTRQIASGLAALDDRAAERGATSFADLPAEAREEVLRAHADEDPMLVPALVFHAYTAYYQHPRVVEALGLPQRAPFPEGFSMEPTDASRLDTMRRRPRLYREV